MHIKVKFKKVGNIVGYNYQSEVMQDKNSG